MDLERVAVQLRPRNGWESVDLGLALTRRWWRPMYARWLALTVPAATLLVVLAGGYGLLLFWWLLPVFEVAVLFTVSRAVFGVTPTGRETLKALPGLWRKGLAEILIRRLHPARIIRLPVGQLEGLRGKQRHQRCATLVDGQDVSMMLLVTFIAFEIGLVMAILGLATMLIPSSLGIDWGLLAERLFNGTLPWATAVAGWLLIAASIAALHPLYVTSGFALYLNQRTKLEGWDLEIAFRRLAKRARDLDTPLQAAPSSQVAKPPGAGPPTTKNVPIIRTLVLILTMALAYTEPSNADPTEPTATEVVEEDSEAMAPEVEAARWQGNPAHDPRQLIADIMARPELQREETIVRWRLREDLLKDRDSTNDRSPNPALKWLARVIAMLGEPLLWLTGAGLLLMLIRVMWRYLSLEPQLKSRRERPTMERIAGLDLRPESLPDNIPAGAAELWTQGQPVAALSLLYRGALARLVDEGLELRESFTEDDCLRSANSNLEGGRLEVFTNLTRTWQRVAYAHQVPDTEAARQLWSVWGEHFGRAT